MLSNAPLPRTKTQDSSEDLANPGASGAGDSGARQTNLQAALDLSCARMKVTKVQRCTTWHVPNNTVARYVRIQLVGFDFLHFAQVEVFGTPGLNKPVGRGGHVECGRNVTMVVVRPVTDQKDIDRAYRRAVLADSHNADILRQYETFALPYDKYGRGERIQRCLICKGPKACEVCELKARFQQELQKLPLGVGGRLPTLDALAQFLLDAPKPPLDYVPKKRKERTRLGRFAEDIGDIFGAVKHVDDASTTSGSVQIDAEQHETGAKTAADGGTPDSDLASGDPGDAKGGTRKEKLPTADRGGKPRGFFARLFGSRKRRAKPVAPTTEGADAPGAKSAEEASKPSTDAASSDGAQFEQDGTEASAP